MPSAAIARAARAILPLLLFAFATLTHAADPAPDVRLYVLDCGRLDFKDLRLFDDDWSVLPWRVVRQHPGRLAQDLPGSG